MYGEARNALIEPFALGLYELIRTYSPELLSLLDPNRDLPWDGEYASWRVKAEDIGDEYRNLNLPSHLRGPLVEMVDMDWPPDNRPRPLAV